MELTNTKSIMNVMPVTKSGFTMGSWDTERIALRERFFMLLMPMAAAVPMMVATMPVMRAISSVSSRALPASPVKMSP